MLTRRKVLAAGSAALLALPGTTLATRQLSAAPRRAKPSQPAQPSQPPPPAVGPPPPSPMRTLLQQARSWSYQLQGYDMGRLRASTADILVVDDSIGTDQGAEPSRQLAALQKKPDGSRRIILAYLSIGEAEEYRYYWKPEWIETATKPEPAEPVADDQAAPADKSKAKAADVKPSAAASPKAAATAQTKPDRWPSKKAPPWLADENDAWSGNFAVRYEDPGWQAIFLDGPQSYLARIVAAGFDGVYLDRVDAFYDHSGNLSDPASAMVDFVARLTMTARSLNPDFLIVPQNGEELLLRPGYVDLIDAIAKEDLLYGSPQEGRPNSTGQIINSVGWLSIARRKGHPVLVVEYLDDAVEIANARLELARLGYIATFAPRLLDALSPQAVPPRLPAPAATPPAATPLERP